MIKKYIFVVLATFSLSAVAGMHDGSNHMSDMAKNSDDGHSGGAFELKYKVIGEQRETSPFYRLRLHWSGEVNEEVTWKVGISSNIEQGLYSSPSIDYLGLEQAYVSYKPFFVEGLKITVGKKGWKSKFNNTGVLYDDDLYTAGASLKYHYSDDDIGVSFKAKYYALHDDFKGPFATGDIGKAKLWGHYKFSEIVTLKAYVSAEADIPTADIALGQIGAKLHFPNLVAEEVPIGVFGSYLTSVKGITDSHSFYAGAYVGNAGTPHSTQVDDFGVGVSYYNVNKVDFNTKLVDTDYIVPGEEAGGRDVRGFAVRAQYNPWGNINAVVKYAYDQNVTGDAEPHNVVGELTFVF